jgi:glycosyltransferase involved in cell wall biosynthesis
MKILWITNTIFPAPSQALGLPIPNTGGWMYSLAAELVNSKSVTLTVATVYDGKQLQCIDLENIQYYLIPKGIVNTKYDSSLEKYWVQIKEEFTPDVIHIHGTEFAHGLAYIRACGNKGVVVSIQGLVSIYSRYYRAGISSGEILRNITFRDVVRQANIFQQQRKFHQRGEIEKEYIRSVDHIIGRTSWDKAHTLAINPNSQYHFNNETLRSSFYTKTKWSYENCEKHSVFLSQAGYPIKGLHQVIKALPLVLREYPDTKVYVAGGNLVAQNSLKDSIRRSGYASYLMTLMRKLKIADRVIFLGSLNEKEMYEQYCKANVFVCPSSIENSPNSLGEAQLVGTPVIASCVGGVPDMVSHGETGLLYRFEEVEMLASLVCKVFVMQDCIDFSENEKKAAEIRHNKEINTNSLLSIYSVINNELK